MSTTIRPEVSEKNENWISRHRYYELKHFCLQYPTWKKVLNSMGSMNSASADLNAHIKTNTAGDPTANCAIAREFYSKRMELVEQTAIKTSSDLSDYILKAVTEGLSYDYLKTNLNIPCCKDTYYKSYRKFFWELSKARQ